jgi:hypothetical protein
MIESTHCPVCKKWFRDDNPCPHMAEQRMIIDSILVMAFDAKTIRFAGDTKTSECNYCNGTGVMVRTHPCICCGGGE